MLPRSKILWIFRGLPGSGKSTAAKSLRCIVIEPQDQWAIRDGVYNWTPEESEIATNKSLRLVEMVMKIGYDLAVAEVLPRNEEVMPYITLAYQYGYKTRVKDMKISIIEAVLRNSHGVSEFDLRKMLDSWEDWDELT